MTHYRSLFFSDVHLGSKGCSADDVLSLLRVIDADTIYLVGDIIDFWQMKSRFYWPQTHNDVVQKILRKARKGARVIYVPGNHDSQLRDFNGFTLGGIEIVNEAIHVTPNGKRLWVIHGDQFDGITTYHQWLAVLGDTGYTISLALNRWINRLRRQFRLPHWSLSAYLKYSIKKAVQFIGKYEKELQKECVRRGFDGVICGHIHHAELGPVGPILYANCGDFVESSTAILEHFDGTLEMISIRDGHTKTLVKILP